MDERLDELLFLRATDGLSAAEEAELEALLRAEPDADRDCYERAAAVVCLATIGNPEGLPDGVRARLENGLRALLGGKTEP